MMHPDTELRLIDQEVGYGVVATHFIPEGTITWVQDELDQVLLPERLEHMNPLPLEKLNKFAFRNRHGNFVLCWDLAKYVNHSFHSNCFSTPYGFEISVRDIAAGEELTDDYGYLNLTAPFQARPEGTTRAMVYPDDLLRYHKEWDQLLGRSFPKIREVAQPLFRLLAPEVQRDVGKVLGGEKKLESIRCLYCGSMGK